MSNYTFGQLNKTKFISNYDNMNSTHLISSDIKYSDNMFYDNYVNLSHITNTNFINIGGAIKAGDNSNPLIKKSENEEQKCAPSKKFEQNSCFDIKGLKEIATAFNTYVHMKIIKGKKVITITNNKDEMLQQIDDRLKDICDDQLCWLEQDFIKVIEHDKREELVDNTFRPDGPKGRFTWLSTVDINAVIDQYKFHKNFKFLGTVPMDFATLPALKIQNLNLDELYNNGVCKLGMVINTDEHYKSGQHWIALYADLSKKQIYFSDSYARVPEKRIRNFVAKIAIWMAKKYNNYTEPPTATFMMENTKNNIESLPGIDIRYNQTRHQYKNSECGIYSMHFVLWLLEGNTFDKYSSTQITDDEINTFREKFFVYHDE